MRSRFGFALSSASVSYTHLGQVGDQAGVDDVAVDAVGLVGHHGLDDVGGELVGALMLDVGVAQQAVAHLVPLGDLVNAPAGILVQGNLEPIDQLRICLLYTS